MKTVFTFVCFCLIIAVTPGGAGAANPAGENEPEAGALSADAQTLDGRALVLEAGPHMTLHAPLSLPWSGETPDAELRVQEVRTGKFFPAAIVGDRFWFVPEGALPHTRHRYEVQLQWEDRPSAVEIVRTGSEAAEVRVEANPVARAVWRGSLPLLAPIYVGDGWPLVNEVPMAGNETPLSAFWIGAGNLSGARFSPGEHASGEQRVESVAHGDSDVYGWLRMELEWRSEAELAAAREVREYRFYRTPERARVIDVFMEMAPRDAAVLIGGEDQSPLVHLRLGQDEVQTVVVDETTAAASGLEEGSSRRAAGCALQTTGGDGTVGGIAVFAHPDNPGFPPRWSFDSDGVLGAAPVVGEKGAAEFDEKVVLRYRLFVYAGARAAQALPARYADFAEPPVVRWAEE